MVRETQQLDFVVEEHEADLRLDAFLAARMHWRSRRSLAELIASGAAFVGIRKAKKSQRLNIGDEVSLEVPVDPSKDEGLSDIELEVLYEDDDLVVVNKPPRLPVHPASTCPHLNLLTRLEYRYRVEAPDPSACPSIVHRLDRDTSGVIAFAKRRELVAFYTGQFEARTTHKTYLAVVHGHLTGSGRIEDPLVVPPARPVHVDVSGKPSRTDYRVVDAAPEHSMLEIEIGTGRKHQIRVHLAHRGHPIVWDDVYGRLDEQHTWPRGASILLHAAALELDHRSGRRLRFEAPEPHTMLRAWRDLSTPEGG